MTHIQTILLLEIVVLLLSVSLFLLLSFVISYQRNKRNKVIQDVKFQIYHMVLEDSYNIKSLCIRGATLFHWVMACKEVNKNIQGDGWVHFKIEVGETFFKPHIIKWMKSRRLFKKIIAIQAMEFISDDSLNHLLLPFLEHPSPFLRLLAMQSAVQGQTEAKIFAVIDAMGKESSWAQYSYRDALLHGNYATHQMIKKRIAKEISPDVKTSCLEILSQKIGVFCFFIALCSSLYALTEEEKGKAFEKEGHFHQALEVYLHLHEEDPFNMEALRNVGRLYALIYEWGKAEEALNRCLEINPQDVDARVALSYVYYWQGKYGEALREAHQVIKEYPDYKEVHLLIGGIMYAERHYKKAYKAYRALFASDPSNRFVERGLIASKLLVRPSLEARSFYVQEREQDLLTPITTTQMTTLDDALKLTYPINDRWMPYAGVVYHLDVQYNLVARTNNYRVSSYFQNIGTIVRFGDFWSLDIESRTHFARNKGEVNLLPFQNRTLWEPQIELAYLSPSQFFILSGIKDSLIARLFAISRSQLISRKAIVTAYEYRFKAPFNGIGASGNMAWYGGSIPNREQDYSLWLRFRLPSATPDFLFRYEFAYKGFKHVLGAYNSFKWRNQHLAKVTYHKEWMPKAYFDLSYSWLWSDTHNLTDQSGIILPNGVTTVPVPIYKNIFRANIVDALIHYVFFQSLHLEGGGRYYHDSNNYRAWNLFARLEMAF